MMKERETRTAQVSENHKTPGYPRCVSALLMMKRPYHQSAPHNNASINLENAVKS